MNYASGEDCPTGACKRVRDKQEIFTVREVFYSYSSSYDVTLVVSGG